MKNAARFPRCPLRSRSALLLGAQLICFGSVLLLVGCDATRCNRLFGSAESTYDLDFDEVRINYQQKDNQLNAMIIEYVRDPGGGGQQIPVKVVANPPIQAGQRHDIIGDGGGLIRTMRDASKFPPMKEGHINFEDLGQPNQETTGKFFTTFDSGRTLNGEFCATTTLQTL